MASILQLHFQKSEPKFASNFHHDGSPLLAATHYCTALQTTFCCSQIFHILTHQSRAPAAIFQPFLAEQIHWSGISAAYWCNWKTLVFKKWLQKCLIQHMSRQELLYCSGKLKKWLNINQACNEYFEWILWRQSENKIARKGSGGKKTTFLSQLETWLLWSLPP